MRVPALCVRAVFITAVVGWWTADIFLSSDLLSIVYASPRYCDMFSGKLGQSWIEEVCLCAKNSRQRKNICLLHASRKRLRHSSQFARYGSFDLQLVGGTVILIFTSQSYQSFENNLNTYIRIEICIRHTRNTEKNYFAMYRNIGVVCFILSFILSFTLSMYRSSGQTERCS